MRVLVIAAHPDDELLGPGGTILRHVKAGDSVHVHLAVCDGLRGRVERLGAAEGLSAVMGTGLTIGDLPQLRVTPARATPHVEALVADHSPDIVYTHAPSDLNRDHRALSEAVAVACRPYASGVRSLRWFETPSSTEWGGLAGLPAFVPTLFVQINATTKAMLMDDHYGMEQPPDPHPRNGSRLVDRALYWGSVSGYPAAEPFMVPFERW